MYTAEQYYGGAHSAGSSTLVYLNSVLSRVYRGAPLTTATYFLPRGSGMSEGGPWWILLNRGSAVIEILRSSGAPVGTVGIGNQVYIFLLDAEANEGEGLWAVAGDGNVFIGGQGTVDFGFNYGSSFVRTGFTMDLGDAANTEGPEHGYDLDFGTAIIPIDPTVPF